MTNDEIIRECKKLWDLNRGKSFESFIKSNTEIDQYLSNMLNNEPWFVNKRNVFVCVVHDIYKKVLCLTCGKELNINKAKSGGLYCNHSCVMKNEIVKKKYKKTCLNKYGVENPSFSEEIKEKKKKNSLEKYGVESVFLRKDVVEKAQKTIFERYGVKSTLSVESVKNKAKQTMLKKYGVDHIFKNKEIRKKAEETCKEKYGVFNAAQSDLIKEKKKQNNIEKYGVEYTTQLESTRKKYRQTMNQRYGADSWFESKIFKKQIYERFSLWKDYVIPLFSMDEYEGWCTGKLYKWKCVKCGNEFEQHIHTTSFDGQFGYIPRCLNCYPYNINNSNSEQEVLNFIKSVYHGDVIENDRQILKGKELDIYLPEKKIAIEYDGLFWHNDKSGKDEKYHLIKTEECEKQGIQLIHIFEDEWIYKKEIVKGRIKSILGLDRTRIYARKCKVKKIDNRTCNEFLQENHLQGEDRSSIRYGLYYENKLVSVMTFGKPRFNKNYDYELIRFCSKIGFQIIGGASKLLEYFKRQYKGSIISYADRRYSMGKLYKKLGFEMISISKPNYWWTKNQIKFSRYQCQKSKLKNILGNNFNPELSEDENMRLNGYDKIYDCGNIVIGMSGPDLDI